MAGNLILLIDWGLFMNISEITDVLYQRYQLNKQIMQTIRRYPELIIVNKQLPPELGYVEQKFEWFSDQYFVVLKKKLIELTAGEIHRLRKTAQSGRIHEMQPDLVLPVSIVFLTRAQGITTWLEEEGPYMQEGSWLNEPNPWEDKGQWPESEGNWYLFYGDHHLHYTAHSKEDLSQYLLDEVYKIASKSDEELRKHKYHKALLDP